MLKKYNKIRIINNKMIKLNNKKKMKMKKNSLVFGKVQTISNNNL